MTLPCRIVVSVVESVLYCNVESIKVPFCRTPRRNCLIGSLNWGDADHIIDFIFTRYINLHLILICSNIEKGI